MCLNQHSQSTFSYLNRINANVQGIQIQATTQLQWNHFKNKTKNTLNKLKAMKNV